MTSRLKWALDYNPQWFLSVQMRFTFLVPYLFNYCGLSKGYSPPPWYNTRKKLLSTSYVRTGNSMKGESRNQTAKSKHGVRSGESRGKKFTWYVVPITQGGVSAYRILDLPKTTNASKQGSHAIRKLRFGDGKHWYDF